MAVNLYEETLEDLDEPQGGPPNPYLKTIDQVDAGRQLQLRQATAAATTTTPDRTAEVLRMAKRLRLPVDVVERNFDEIKKRAAIEGSPYAEWLRETPVLAKWAAEPENMKLAADDLEPLGALEWLLAAPARALAQGIGQLQFGRLKAESLFRPLTQQEEDYLYTQKLYMEMGGELGAGQSWFRKAITGGARQLPNYFGGALYAAKYAGFYGLPAATGGALVGTALPGVGTAAGFTAGMVGGMRVGATYGVWRFGFEIEAGHAKAEYEDFRDEHGQPLDPDVIRAAALATGAINGGLELVQFQKILKSIPGLNKLGALGVRAGVKKALLNPTIRAGLLEAVKSYGATLTWESATEVAQRATTILLGELGKVASGQPMEFKTAPSILEELGQELVGALFAFAIPSGLGPLMQVQRAAGLARRGQQTASFFTALGEGVTQSKTFNRLPEAAQGLVAAMTKDGPLEHVYVPVEPWMTYWQAQGVDPAAIAAEITGQPAALEQAQKTGEDLVIPMSRYATTLAGSTHNAFFAQELRLAPGEMNAREGKVFEEALAAAEPAVITETRATEIRQQVTAQLVAAGVPEAKAQTYARLYHETFGTLAERAGVDPLEFFRQYGFRVTRPDLEAAPVEAPPPGEADVVVGAAVAPTTETAAVSPAPAGQLAALEPEIPGLAVLEAVVGTAEIEEVTDEGVAFGGSAESAASLEAIRRQEGMAAAGERFGVYDRAGRFRPLIGPEAVDYRPATGETFGILSPAGFQVLTDSGGRVPLDTSADVAQHLEEPHAAELAGTAPGAEFRDRAGEQPVADEGGPVEALRDELRAERRRLPSPDRDEIFSRQSPEANAARFTPEVTRELQAIIEELETFPYIGRSWSWLAETEKSTGNAAGGKANIVAGAGGAEVYHDIIAYAPVARVTHGTRKGLPGREAAGTRVKVREVVRQALETKDIRTGLAEGAVRVAERRAIDDFSIISLPALPRPWGREASVEFTETLSAAITDALQAGNMLDEASMESDILEPEGPVDTSFNVDEFYQSAFDRVAPDTGVEALAQASPEPAPRKVRKGARVIFQGKEYFLAKIYPTHVELQEWAWHEAGIELSGLLSVSIRRFWAGYRAPVAIAEPQEKVDVLDTGEIQPRLPGDVGAVRDLHVPTPEFEAPYSLTPEPAVRKGKQTTLFQPAYHGSAQKFDRFSLHAIGTGEGAQAYGWGLYFASLREVAEQYRKSLAGPGFEKGLALDGERIFGPQVTPLYTQLIQDPRIHTGLLELYARAYFEKPGKVGIANIRESVERSIANLRRHAENGTTWTGDRNRDKFDLEKNEAALYVLDTFADRLDILPPDKPGRVYKVDIPEDEDLLSWDHTASRQSPKVQAALQTLGFTWTPDPTPTWKEARDLFDTRYVQELAHEDIGARESLREGLQYVKTENAPAFDLWYQQHVGLLRERGRIEPTGEQMYATLLVRPIYLPLNAQEQDRAAHRDHLAVINERASGILNAAGIVGIRYLDGFSRSKSEGTSNYVIFDDRLIQITEFYQRLAEPARLTTADVHAWAEDLKGKIGPDLEALDLSLSNQGDLYLGVLAVRRGAVRAGLGTRVMQEVTRYADRNGLRIVLSLAPKGDQPIAEGEKTTSRSRLEQFYRRFGFVRNAGRHKDVSITGNMYREPTLGPGLPEMVSGVVRTADPMSPSMLEQEKRGAIRFGADRQFSIALLEKADASTFLHESGHFFLEIMGDLVDRLRAMDPGALSETQRGLLGDYAGLLDHFGVETRDAITTEHHEEFARLFEAYLMEGRAPSLALESAFARFRAWLIGVYRSLTQLHVELTPEVRAILDRLVASDQAIAEAEQRRGVEALFTTAETAGMTAAEFGLYRETVARASRTARQQLDAKLLREVRREQESSWKARREEIRGEIEANVYQRPEYRALAAITRGTHPNGESLVEGLDTKPLRLSRSLLVDAFGADRLKRLPAFTYVRDGGVDPETVAAMFGFEGADALVTALEVAAPMRQVIEQETTAQMLQEHGSLLLDGTLGEVAEAAVANEDRDSIIRAELRALTQLKRTVAPFVRAEQVTLAGERRERTYERRWLAAEANLVQAIAVGKKQVEIDALRTEVQNLRQKARGGAATINAAIPPPALIRDNARARVARMKIREVKPALFWSASRRAAQQAIERAARQDFDGAIVAKQQELVNLAIYRETERALEDVAVRVRFAKDLGTKASRARLGLAGQNYQDQVDGILDAYQFARVPLKALERRASLVKFLAGLESAGLPVPEDLPPALLDETRRTNYQNLTVEELVGVTDGLKMILHLARLKNRLLKAQDEREFAEVRTVIVDSINAHSAARALPLEFTGEAEARRRLADWFASHTKISQLAQALDGYVDGGPMWQYVIRPINEAANAEAARNAETGKAYTAMLNRFYTSKDLGRFSRPLRIEAIGASLSTEARLVVALNWGNQTSRDRLLADPQRRWNLQQIEAILATLDKRDWDFVQASWDFLETFWPEIAAKQERVVGVAPEKVEALPVKTAYGDYRGGYYPLMYDPRLNLRSQQLEAASEARGILQAAYVSNTTKRGHIETRKAHVNLSVRLDLGVIFQHMQQVIHDLTHHEALLDVQRVLRDSAVASAILNTKGDLVYQQFTRALQDIAAGNVNGRRPTVLDRAATYMRTGTQLSILGLNVWTAAQQPLGLFNGMARVGPMWVARGARRWLRDAAHMEHTVRWINSVSPMMKYRMHTATQDLSELRLALGRAGGWFDKLVRKVSGNHLTQTALLDGYLFHIGLAQRVADVPTWLGQYEKTKAAGGTEVDAIALADQVVLDSQGAGQIKDLAQVQRGGPVARLFMVFYTYFNTLFNASARAFGQTNYRSPVSILELIGNLGLLYFMPALFTITMSRLFGRTEDDDEGAEGFLKDVGREMLSTAMNTIVGVRELSGLVQFETRGWSGPAGARLIQVSYNLGRHVEQGELDAAFFRALNQTGGILFRYPAAQAQRSVDGFIALEEGRTRNPFALVVGPARKGAK